MLQVKNISFKYLKKPVLQDIDFVLNAGEHLSIIGESGSGKSTLLKLLYGELDANQGSIFWKDNEILGPKHNLVVGYDFMKYVSQEFDLMPYTTVAENIGKHLSNFYPEEKQARIKELLEVVELTPFTDTKVKLLSGGQKQRVALARALANAPEIILLDEPFSHIDNYKKQSLRRRLFHFLKENNIACIVASHDKEDVLPYSDKMIVLNEHKIVANNSPKHLYKYPESPLIASFFGEFNVIDGKIIYAHQIEVVGNSNLKATVKTSYFKGPFYLIEADLNGQTILLEHKDYLDKNTEIYLIIK
ncbi:ABC transporter ATP-binding protein [Xanthomarina sp.]|uniref:ABC transporter ATP-binding protein n=1 Tax=Xanthomarina sp. TaxID=1931211 RepID=UPI002C42B956|nr:ABC transporter ATP-binding protein [Xanthomarina sp.]HLV40030.1 ABC transporter ATP-binding protein [Xanthomarina sp.]